MAIDRKTRTIPAGEFKAKCLALMDEVARTGEAVVITKRGKPVARLSSAAEPDEAAERKWLKDMILYIGDVESPAADPDDWEALQ